jgi:hypothetical protein
MHISSVLGCTTASTRERESGNGKRDRGIGVSSSDIFDNLNVAQYDKWVSFSTAFWRNGEREKWVILSREEGKEKS